MAWHVVAWGGSKGDESPLPALPHFPCFWGGEASKSVTGKSKPEFFCRGQDRKAEPAAENAQPLPHLALVNPPSKFKTGGLVFGSLGGSYEGRVLN